MLLKQAADGVGVGMAVSGGLLSAVQLKDPSCLPKAINPDTEYQ